MLTVNLICIGKLKEEYWRKASAEYEKRLSGFCKLQIIELPETRTPDNPSPAQTAQVIESEGKLILQKLPAGGAVIPMCIEGKEYDSVELSRLLERFPLEGKSTVSFVIGGSCGLSDAVKARGDVKLSMSKLTFPHQLARIMLLEQIYRSFQISSGGKYHK
ncbi:MAG: 23S rRNA (pseudouridine(1915)-N(3))-methyltransferase RlmH [Oscillospiraceae bacterium]|nr:23S rRNA (pseudouridine(1915)-N(3))-methyltransferase RlmH [Oscillospiraceae bacterium]